MARTAAGWLKIVLQQVGYCYADQPRDDDFDWFLGERTTLRELFETLQVPEHLWERVASRVRCPYCGDGGFDVGDQVGTYDFWEREALRRSAEWSKKWKPELDAFARHLAAFPYLGMAHPMGQRIADAIDELPLETLKDELWWRARKPDGARDFSVTDMFPPRPRYAQSEGRYNHFGQVVFYLASSPEGAIREVLQEDKHEVVAWVQQFRVTNLLNVLNLTESDPTEMEPRSVLAAGLVSSLRSLTPKANSPWKPQYFVPRFVADCARRRGVDAVMFSSSKWLGRNLVVFEPQNPSITAQGQPRLFMLSKEQNEGRVEEIVERNPEF